MELAPPLSHHTSLSPESPASEGNSYIIVDYYFESSILHLVYRLLTYEVKKMPEAPGNMLAKHLPTRGNY